MRKFFTLYTVLLFVGVICGACSSQDESSETTAGSTETTATGTENSNGKIRDAGSDHVLVGLSMSRDGVIPRAEQLGVQAVRPTLTWKELEPNYVAGEQTLAAVKADATFLSTWSAAHEWDAPDQRITGLVNTGMEVVPIVGHGYTTTLPLVDGKPATPDAIGRDAYLMNQYVVTRAMVERYDGDGRDDAPGSPRINIWQTENELNQAAFAAIFGQRSPGGFAAVTSAWADFSFLTLLLTTLQEAVHDADSTAKTTMNFHTDVNPALNKAFGQVGWPEAVTQWSELMDIVSFDSYPNYYKAEPVNGNAVGEVATAIKEQIGDKPLWVMETGYPTGPTERGYSEENQKIFFDQAFTSATAAGVDGFFWFGTQTADEGGVVGSTEDLALLTQIADGLLSDDPSSMLATISAELSTLEERLGPVLQSVEYYWGVVRPDETLKPAGEALAAAAGR